MTFAFSCAFFFEDDILKNELFDGKVAGWPNQ